MLTTENKGRESSNKSILMLTPLFLPKSDRGVNLQRLFANPALKEDLIDVATWYERRAGRAISYHRVRQQLKKVGRL